MHHSRPCEVNITLPQTEVSAKIGKPATSPSPVSKEWIDESRKDKRGDGKSGKFPAFYGCASWNRGRCIHENHLEQKKNHDSDIVRAVMHEEEAVLPEKSEWLPEQSAGVLG